MPFSASLTLLVSDPNTGTAGFTVGNCTTGRTIQIYSAPYQSGPGPIPWTLRASGTATSSVFTATAAVGFGYYQWIAIQLDAGGVNADSMSALNYTPLRPLANSVESVWEQCCDSVVSLIQSLVLPGISSANIEKVWFPLSSKNQTPKCPAIQVSPIGKETSLGQLTSLDDIGYPVLITMRAASNQQSQGNLNPVLMWRQTISRSVRFQQIAGVPSNWYTDVIPDVVLNPDLFLNANMVVSSLIFQFRSREPRGIGA